MSISHQIHFNALPESVRRRWVERLSGRETPGPLHAEPLSSGLVDFGSLALLGLATLGFACWYGFGQPSESSVLQAPAWLVAYVGGGLMLVYGLLGLMRRRALRKALPFAPGRYLFGLDLVEACGEVLTLWPMAKCRDIRSKNHYSKSGYTHTSITFFFEGGHKKTIEVRGMAEAKHLLGLMPVS